MIVASVWVTIFFEELVMTVVDLNIRNCFYGTAELLELSYDAKSENKSLLMIKVRWVMVSPCDENKLFSRELYSNIQIYSGQDICKLCDVRQVSSRTIEAVRSKDMIINASILDRYDQIYMAA